MVNKIMHNLKFFFWFVSLLLLPNLAFSAGVNGAEAAQGFFNNVGKTFKEECEAIGFALQLSASYLFWTLAGIALAWQAIEMTLRRAEIGDIFSTLVKYIITTGFFWFLCVHGSEIGYKIAVSFEQLAGLANAGFHGEIGPSELIDLGYELVGDEIFGKLMSQYDSMWYIPERTLLIFMSIFILLIMFILAIKLLLKLIQIWGLVYIGAFFLGFGGASWTQDWAKKYFYNVLAKSAEYFAMVVVVCIMKGLIQNYVAKFELLSIMDSLSLLLPLFCAYFIFDQLPVAIAGVVGGSGGGTRDKGLMGSDGGMLTSVHTGGKMLGLWGEKEKGGGAAAASKVAKAAAVVTGVGSTVVAIATAVKKGVDMVKDKKKPFVENNQNQEKGQDKNDDNKEQKQDEKD